MLQPKNVLFINPWIYDFAAYDFWLSPLGFLYIAAVVRNHSRCRVHYIDCLDRNHPGLRKPPKIKEDGRGHFPKEEVAKPGVLRRVPRRYSRYGIPVALFEEELDKAPVPDLVFMTCTMTYWYPGVQAAVELVRKKFGRVPVVLGGIYATLLPEHARECSGADLIVQGPGENQILPLLRDILGDGAVEIPRFESLEGLPRPAFDLLRSRRWLPLLTSRGCPYRCSFCASSLLHGGFEQRSPGSVLDEIEVHAAQYGAAHFAFYDDALFLNKEKHLVPILESVVRKGLPVSFHTPNGVHLREIDEEFARLLRAAGVKSLYLSQETIDEDLLAQKTPKVSAGDLTRALMSLEKAGYRRKDVYVYLIAGLPGQEARSVRESILHVLGLGATPRLALFSPIPGTAEWEAIVARGILPRNADPLLHNKLTFPYVWGEMSPHDFASIRRLLQ